MGVVHGTAPRCCNTNGATETNTDPAQVSNQILTSAADCNPPTSKDAERALRNFQRLQEWKAENPAAFEAVDNLAISLAKAGTKVCCSTLAGHIRHHNYTSLHGAKTTINNDIVPALLRDIAHLHPDIDMKFEGRTHIYDGLWSR